jgi:hypothetical protein
MRSGSSTNICRASSIRSFVRECRFDKITSTLRRNRKWVKAWGNPDERRSMHLLTGRFLLPIEEYSQQG